MSILLFCVCAAIAIFVAKNLPSLAFGVSLRGSQTFSLTRAHRLEEGRILDCTQTPLPVLHRRYVLCAVLSGILPCSTFEARASTEVNTDPISLLQIALPLEQIFDAGQCNTVRALQFQVESIVKSALDRSYNRFTTAVRATTRTLAARRNTFLELVQSSRRAVAENVLQNVDAELRQMEQDAKDVSDTLLASAQRCQGLVGQFEELLVPPGFAARLPQEFQGRLPVLEGRATVQLLLRRATGDGFVAEDGQKIPQASMTCVVDGWSAPLTAGNFVDLVDERLYDGVPFEQVEGLSVLTGAVKNETSRKIPLEIALQSSLEALYHETIDESGVAGAKPRLPFQANGALGMARDMMRSDSATSKVFFLNFQTEEFQAQSTGTGKWLINTLSNGEGSTNFIDGQYACFGYVTQGAFFLKQLRVGDTISAAKVVDGLHRLRRTA